MPQGADDNAGGTPAAACLHSHPLPTIINPTALNLVLVAQQGEGGKGGELRGRRRSETDARQLWALQHLGN